MRKYRGLTKEGIWHYGWYGKAQGRSCIIPLDAKIGLLEGMSFEDLGIYPFVEVIPETVGQSTGLKDKNGKEIYEGDICLAALPEERFPVETVWYSAKAGFLFQWNDNTYESGKDEMEIDLFTDVEVIGNIHQNPELLENKNG